MQLRPRVHYLVCNCGRKVPFSVLDVVFCVSVVSAVVYYLIRLGGTRQRIGA